MTTATDTPTITAQECFNNAAEAVRNDDISKSMAWKDIGDGLVRLQGLIENARQFDGSRPA